MFTYVMYLVLPSVPRLEQVQVALALLHPLAGLPARPVFLGQALPALPVPVRPRLVKLAFPARRVRLRRGYARERLPASGQGLRASHAAVVNPIVNPIL